MRYFRSLCALLAKRWHDVIQRYGIPVRLFWLIQSHLISRCVYVAAQLGIADLLDQGPKTSAELAAATGTSEPQLRRVLRALASCGVFAQDRQGRFRLTREGALLRKGAPFSLRSWAILSGEEAWSANGKLLEALKTGKNAFELAYGMPCWDYLEQTPHARAVFDDGMGTWTTLHAPEVVASCDLSQARQIVDVGGGRGSLMVALLTANPHLHGVVYDRPEAVDTCKRYIAAAGLSNRCEVLGGNFLEWVPPSDAYIIKHALHDWSDERALEVLKSIRGAIEPNGRLLIVDAIVREGNRLDRQVIWQDISQLLCTPGHERTEAEFGRLIREAGFELEHITHSFCTDLVVLECRARGNAGSYSSQTSANRQIQEIANHVAGL